MSTWEEKGNEKTPIPLLPKPIALQKHHKVYLADDDDQWSSRSYNFQISIVGIWYQIYLSYLHLMWVSKAISTKCISTIFGQSQYRWANCCNCKVWVQKQSWYRNDQFLLDWHWCWSIRSHVHSLRIRRGQRPFPPFTASYIGLTTPPDQVGEGKSVLFTKRKQHEVLGNTFHSKSLKILL